MCFTFFFPLASCATCRILVPWPGIEPMPPAVEVWSSNHWTAREVPEVCYFKHQLLFLCLIYILIKDLRGLGQIIFWFLNVILVALLWPCFHRRKEMGWSRIGESSSLGTTPWHSLATLELSGPARLLEWLPYAAGWDPVFCLQPALAADHV